jgi:carbonic anhydrase
MSFNFSRRCGFNLLAIIALSWSVSASAGITGESPIEIDGKHTQYALLPALTFNLSSNESLDVKNTGSPDIETSIKATPSTTTNTLTVTGDPNTYTLLQFHFHEPSEHLINNTASDMELHMVFSADGTNPSLVVGRLIELGAHNTLLDPIFNQLSTGLANPNSHITVSNFNLGDLLPSTFFSFRYPGSLTTAPYTTGIQWILLAEGLTMDQGQIDAFHTLFFNGNSREVQPLNGRIVLTDVVGFVPEPSSIALLMIGLTGFALTKRRQAV